LPKFVTFNVSNASCGQPLSWSIATLSFLLPLNLEKGLQPEQLVIIKLRNKASRGWIN